MTTKDYKTRIEASKAKLAKASERRNKLSAKFTELVNKYNRAKGTSFSTNAEDYKDYYGLRGLSEGIDFDFWWDISSTHDNWKTSNRKIKELGGIIERYEALIAKQNDKESTNEKAIKRYKPALVAGCEEYHKYWIAVMQKKEEEQYDYIRENLDKATEICNRLQGMRYRSPFYYYYMAHHKLSAKVDNGIKKCNEIINHRAAKMAKADYLAYTEAEYEKHWNACMEKLAVKLLPFNLTNITAKAYAVDGKGLECTITEGNRIINARVIWAALYSDIVTAHERYIITEHTAK